MSQPLPFPDACAALVTKPMRSDEGVNFGIQTGINLSRSQVLFFKHNDMADLEAVLEDVREKDVLAHKTKLNRRFIIVEGIYQVHADCLAAMNCATTAASACCGDERRRGVRVCD